MDTLGGLLSLLLLGTLILAINFAPVPDSGTLIISLIFIAAATGILFIRRERRVQNPLYDLKVASRKIFWVAASAGIIVFGALMGAMYIGQQFLQNDSLLHSRCRNFNFTRSYLYDPVAHNLPSWLESHGSRFTLLAVIYSSLGF